MKALFLLVVALMLAGCASPNYQNLSSQYASVDALIKAEFPKPTYFSITHGDINPFHYRRTERPRNALDAFCTSVEKGTFRPVEQQHVLSGMESVNRYFGVFGCYDQHDLPTWLVDVRYHRDQYQQDYFTVAQQPVMEYLLNEYEQGVALHQQQVSAQQARDLFNARANASKAVGEQVCTADNYFGYVQQVASDNLQVHVIGRGRLEPYALFNNEDLHFMSDRLEEPQWAPSQRWAQCNFN